MVNMELYLSYSYGSEGKPPLTRHISVLWAAVSSVLIYSSLPAFDADKKSVEKFNIVLCFCLFVFYICCCCRYFLLLCVEFLTNPLFELLVFFETRLRRTTLKMYYLCCVLYDVMCMWRLLHEYLAWSNQRVERNDDCSNFWIKRSKQSQP